MPPKTVFTKEQIIATAFEIFKEEGIESLSVRKLAARMNSSTAPIYTSFENVDDIKQQLLEHALNILTGYTEKQYTGDAFLNLGLGLLEFARDYKTIYRKLFMEDDKYQYILQSLSERNLIQMKKVEYLKCFNDTDLASMLDKMSTYTYGLATMLCAGMLTDESHEYFLKELGEMGCCVIGAYASMRGYAKEFESVLKEGCML